MSAPIDLAEVRAVLGVLVAREFLSRSLARDLGLVSFSFSGLLPPPPSPQARLQFKFPAEVLRLARGFDSKMVAAVQAEARRLLERTKAMGPMVPPRPPSGAA